MSSDPTRHLQRWHFREAEIRLAVFFCLQSALMVLGNKISEPAFIVAQSETLTPHRISGGPFTFIQFSSLYVAKTVEIGAEGRLGL